MKGCPKSEAICFSGSDSELSHILSGADPEKHVTAKRATADYWVNRRDGVFRGKEMSGGEFSTCFKPLSLLIKFLIRRLESGCRKLYCEHLS